MGAACGLLIFSFVFKPLGAGVLRVCLPGFHLDVKQIIWKFTKSKKKAEFQAENKISSRPVNVQLGKLMSELVVLLDYFHKQEEYFGLFGLQHLLFLLLRVKSSPASSLFVTS